MQDESIVSVIDWYGFVCPTCGHDVTDPPMACGTRGAWTPAEALEAAILDASRHRSATGHDVYIVAHPDAERMKQVEASFQRDLKMFQQLPQSEQVALVRAGRKLR